MSETQCHQVALTGALIPGHCSLDCLEPALKKHTRGSRSSHSNNNDKGREGRGRPPSPRSVQAMPSATSSSRGSGPHTCEVSSQETILSPASSGGRTLALPYRVSNEELCSPRGRQPGSFLSACLPCCISSGAKDKGSTAPSFAPLPAEVLMRDYLVGDIIGEGRFGSVWRCVDKSTRGAFACKQVDKMENPEQLMLELECLARAQGHPNVLQLESIFESERSLLIVTELCTQGDLYGHILRNRFLRESEARALFRQLAEAVRHCHARGVVHRDIKPENILLQQCPATGQTVVRLADFGLATVLRPGETAAGWVGSQPYEAPEVANHWRYDHSVDTFSLGVVLFSMLSGRWPSFKEGKVFDEEGSFTGAMWQGVSSEARDLITSMLSFDPQRRPRAEEILRHPWLTEGQPQLAPARRGDHLPLGPSTLPEMRLHCSTVRPHGGRTDEAGEPAAVQTAVPAAVVCQRPSERDEEGEEAMFEINLESSVSAASLEALSGESHLAHLLPQRAEEWAQAGQRHLRPSFSFMSKLRRAWCCTTVAPSREFF